MSMNVNGNNAAQKAHNVKFTPLKAGVRKTDLQDPKLQSIFRQHDLNNNGILEENEAFRMNNALEKMMSNGRVSQSEVNNFAGQEQQNQFNVSDMLNLVSQLGQASTSIASCVTNSQNQVSVTYNPTEAGTLTENFNQQTGVLESNQLVKDNVTTMNNFTMIEGLENPVKTDTTIITMDPNNPQNTTPLTVENQQWTLPEGATEPVMTTQTILDNTTGTETTNYFSEDGTTLVGTLIQKGAQTIEMDGQGRTISNTQTLPNGMGEEVTTYEYAEGSDKPVKETTTSPLKGTITKETDGDKETVTTEKDGKKTVDVYENGVKKSQSFTDANGITYEVEYTASGNTKLKAFGPNGETKGFFVQSGESIEKLARQCGFDNVDEFKATMTNKKGESTTKFNVNNSFEMKGQVSAEDAAAFANGRKSMEVNRNQGNAAEIERQEAVEAKKQAEIEAAKQQEVQQTNPEGENVQNKKLSVSQKVNGLASAIRKTSDTEALKEAVDNMLRGADAAEIMQVLNAYERREGSSFFEDLNNEWFVDDKDKFKMISDIVYTIKRDARNAGLDERLVEGYTYRGTLHKDFQGYWLTDKGAQKLNTNLKTLAGEMSKVKSSAQMDAVDAAKLFAGENTTDVKTAQAVFDAREDNNFGIVGDTVLGWFGCTTIDDMKEQLGIDADVAQTLVDSANSGDMDKFNAAYKKAFGKNFDPKTVAVYQEAQERYQLAYGIQSVRDSASSLIREIDHETAVENGQAAPRLKTPMEQASEELGLSMDPYKGMSTDERLASKIMDTLHLTKDEFEALLKANGGGREGMKSMLNVIKNNCIDKLEEIGNTGTISSEIKNLRTSMFGGKDIVKDVEKFNKNMMYTAIGTELVFDVAVAVATGPALGAAAGSVGGLATGARTAVMAKNISTLAQTSKNAQNALKLYNSANKFYKTSKSAQAIAKGGKYVAKGVVKEQAKASVKSAVSGEEMKEINYADSAKNKAVRGIETKMLSSLTGVKFSVAGKMLNVAEVASNYSEKIYDIANNSQNPRAEIMQKFGVGSDVAETVLDIVMSENYTG